MRRNQPQLLEHHPRHRRRGASKALVPIDCDRCPACGFPTLRHVIREPALFYFGGYGATRQTTSIACTATQCHWSMTVEVTEVRPER